MDPVLCCGLGVWGWKAPGKASGADGPSTSNVVQLSKGCAALGGCASVYLGQRSCCQTLPAGTRTDHNCRAGELGSGVPAMGMSCNRGVTPVVEAMDGRAVSGESWSGAVKGEDVYWRGVLWLTWSSLRSAPALPQAPLPCCCLSLPYASSMAPELPQGSAPCPSPSRSTQ